MSNMQYAEWAAGRYVPVSEASRVDRVTFVGRVYRTFLAGLGTFFLTAWLGTTNETVLRFALGVTQSWILYLALVFGAVFAVQKLSTIPGVNLWAFLGFAGLFGILTTPLILYAVAMTGGWAVVTEATVYTSILFVGLSAFAVFGKVDFTVHRSLLVAGLLVVLGLSVVGIFVGFSGSPWMSILWILIISGYVVYDTQMIMRRYPKDMHVSAAISLFIDFIVLFQRILMLLSRRR